MYREIFSKHFPSPAAASTVPHVSISHSKNPRGGGPRLFRQVDWTRHATSAYGAGLDIEIPKMGIFLFYLPANVPSTHSHGVGWRQVEKTFSRLDNFSYRAVCPPL
jgi:hypothetical protein